MGVFYIKKMQYTYNYDPEMYRYILTSNILNKKKNEHKIFEKLVQGYNCEEISKKYHYSERTIHNRRRDIYLKTKRYMINCITDEEKEKIFKNIRFKIYLLRFPNNKIYIGMTSNEIKRWNNGNGYKDNENMYEDILLYGWDNIEKEILFEQLEYKDAVIKEKEMIRKYNSLNKDIGYNRTI